MADTTSDTRPGVGYIKDFFQKVNRGEVDDMFGQLEKVYDSWGAQYDKDLIDAGYIGPQLSTLIVKELFPSNKEALIIDCGAGTGLGGKSIHSVGYTNIIGVDLSEKCLEIAMKSGAYKKVVKCAVGEQKLPLEDNVGDILITIGSMSPTHIPPESLEDQTRVVKSGGYLVTIMRKVQVSGSPDMIKRFDDKFEESMDNLKNSKKLTLVDVRAIPRYVDGKEGIIYISKVL